VVRLVGGERSFAGAPAERVELGAERREREPAARGREAGAPGPGRGVRIEDLDGAERVAGGVEAPGDVDQAVEHGGGEGAARLGEPGVEDGVPGRRVDLPELAGLEQSEDAIAGGERGDRSRVAARQGRERAPERVLVAEREPRAAPDVAGRRLGRVAEDRVAGRHAADVEGELAGGDRAVGDLVRADDVARAEAAEV